MSDRPTVAPEVTDPRIVELRLAFDSAFTLPSQPNEQEIEDVLTARVSGDWYAFRLRDLASLISRPAITPVPSSHPDLLGIAGIRGTVTPIFGLSTLLGYGRAEPPNWIALCGTDDPIGFAFSEFERFIRAPTGSFYTDEHVRVAGQFLTQTLDHDDRMYPVVNLPLLLTTIRHRRQSRRPTKESL